LDPMGKMFQNASSLKPLGQLKPNCPGIIIWWSSKKFGFFMPIRNSRWWFSPRTPVSFINKTDCHNITEILFESGVKHHDPLFRLMEF
jgi:hypothetical protein